MVEYLDDLNAVCDILLNNKVILSPTDTVWGLACHAFSRDAFEKMHLIKNRPENNAFVLLVDSIKNLKRYIVDIHPRIETLIHFHERPLSVIYKANDRLPPFVVSDKGTVAFRVTRDPMLRELVSMLGAPLISSSANPGGRPAPKNFADLEESIKSKVDYIFQTGRNTKPIQKPSMLISYNSEGELIFHRQ